MKTIVLGPPGTGKTTTLLNKVDDYLKQTDPDKVGYFAFTQKAAYEARDRAIKKFLHIADLTMDTTVKIKAMCMLSQIEGYKPKRGKIYN